MNAYEVGKSNTSIGEGGFGFVFGISQTKVAAKLRELADAIEKRSDEPGAMIVLADDEKPRISVQRLAVETVAEHDDFARTRITIEVAERLKVTP